MSPPVLLWPARYPVTDAIELAELLDIDVEDLAWVGVLITPHRLGRLERGQALMPNRFRMRLTSPPTATALYARTRQASASASSFRGLHGTSAGSLSHGGL
jgi:hypothetical protein